MEYIELLELKVLYSEDNVSDAYKEAYQPEFFLIEVMKILG